MVKTTNSRLESYLTQSKAILNNFSTIQKKSPISFGTAFLGVLGGMNAQIVYSDIQNINCNLPNHSNRCYADINNAGGNDFEIHRNVVGANVFIQVDEVLGGGFMINGFHAQLEAGYVYPYANASNVNIGPALPWNFQVGQANSLSDNGVYPNHKWEPLPNGTTRFIGIRGTISGDTKYGWIRLTKNSFGNYTIVDWAYESSGSSITTGAGSEKVGIGTTNPSNRLTVAGSADITGKLAIGKPNASTNLDVEGGIRTSFSGSVNINITSLGAQTINLGIVSLPGGWTFENTGVVVTNVDGGLGVIRQAKITATNNIQLNYDALTSGSTRFNYVIFKL